jgi:hypothetical protein
MVKPMDWFHGVVERRRGQVHGRPTATQTQGMVACHLRVAPRALQGSGAHR